MTTFRDSIPTFLNGISQQNAALRDSNLLDDAVNWEFLPSEGLTKRYPTEYVGELRTFAGDSIDLTGAHFVALERDDQDYILAFYTDEFNVGRWAAWDAEGNPVEVVNTIGGDDNQFDYVAQTPSVDLRTQQVADAVYVANRAVTVDNGPGQISAQWYLDNPGAGAAVLQGGLSIEYSITVKTEQMSDRVTVAHRTPSGTNNGDHPATYTALANPASAPGTWNAPLKADRIPFFAHGLIVDEDVYDANPGTSGWRGYVQWDTASDLEFFYTNTIPSPNNTGASIPKTQIPSADFAVDSFSGAIKYLGSDANVLAASYWIVHQNRDVPAVRNIGPAAIIRHLAIQLQETFDGTSADKPLVTIEGNYAGRLNNKADSRWDPENEVTSNAIRAFFAMPGVLHDIEYWSVGDSEGGTFSSGWQSEIGGIAELPVFWKDGAVVKLTGGTLNKADDEFVEFKIEGGTVGDFGRGVWRETVERDLPDGSFALDTMPHLIRREFHNGAYRFTLGYGSWNGRSVGDQESSPEPSFVGERIFDIFWHENRLGVVAGPNLIMSESGNAKNFWRTTLNAVSDSDPIDVTLTNLDGDTAFNAVPYDGSLMVFAEAAQTRVQSEGPLSISSIEAPVVSGFRCSPRVRPIVSGRSLFFAYTTGDFTQIRQLVPGQYRADFQDAQTTIAVDKLIPNSTRKLIPNHTSDALVVLTDDRSQLFIHQYLQTNRESLMSAWGRWEFPDSNIEDVLMISDRLFLPLVRDGKTSLESLLFGAGRGDQLNNFKPRLDRLSEATGATYDRNTDSTTWTVPFDFTADTTLALTASSDAVLRLGATVTDVTSDPVASTVTAPGDLTGQPMVVGVPYDSRFVLSKPILKQPSYRGGMFAPVGGRQICRDIIFNLADTGYARAEVTVVGGQPSTEEFVAYNDNTGALVPTTTRNGEFRVPIFAEVDEFSLTVSNPTSMPSTFVSGAWTIRYNQKKANR